MESWMAAALVSSSDQSYTSKGIYAGCWAAICPRHHDTSPLYLFEVLHGNACWIRVTETTAHHPNGGGSRDCVLLADLLKPNFASSSSRCSSSINVNKPWIIFNVKDAHHLFTHAFQHCQAHEIHHVWINNVKVCWCGSLGRAKSLFVSSKSLRGSDKRSVKNETLAFWPISLREKFWPWSSITLASLSPPEKAFRPHSRSSSRYM